MKFPSPFLEKEIKFYFTRVKERKTCLKRERILRNPLDMIFKFNLFSPWAGWIDNNINIINIDHLRHFLRLYTWKLLISMRTLPLSEPCLNFRTWSYEKSISPPRASWSSPSTFAPPFPPGRALLSPDDISFTWSSTKSETNENFLQ